MTLSKQQVLDFRKKAHHLKPVILIGNQGLTEAVQLETNRALDDHELIKIKINAEREERKQIAAAIVAEQQAQLIQSIGNTITIYRKSEKNKKAPQ